MTAASVLPALRVLPTDFGPGVRRAPQVPAAPVPAVQARQKAPAIGTPAAGPKKPQPQTLPRITEKQLAQAVARWLEGEAWPYDHASFRPYHGLNVRLREQGDQLVEDGVPVLSRNPTVLLELPEGCRTGDRLGAREVCAVAVRGHAGLYR